MPFNISTFQTTVAKLGYLPTSKFEVILSPPPILQNNSLYSPLSSSSIQEIANGMKFRIEGVRTPGISILTADVNHYGIGPTQKQPYSAQFSENAFFILCDRFSLIWQFWHDWTRNVFEYTGTTNAQNSTQVNRVPSYTSNFKNEYSTTMQIIIYDYMGNKIQTINMFEAYPTAIREVPLSWNDSNNLIRLNIGIAYTDFTIENSGIGITNNPNVPNQPVTA